MKGHRHINTYNNRYIDIRQLKYRFKIRPFVHMQNLLARCTEAHRRATGGLAVGNGQAPPAWRLPAARARPAGLVQQGRHQHRLPVDYPQPGRHRHRAPHGPRLHLALEHRPIRPQVVSQITQCQSICLCQVGSDAAGRGARRIPV